VARFLVTAGALFLPALTRLIPARRALDVAALLVTDRPAGDPPYWNSSLTTYT
jgi:hypothetical protein